MTWLLVFAAMAVAVASVLVARWCLLVVRVVGLSMLPALRHQERVLALRSPYGRPVRHGDLVVYHLPARAFGHSAADVADTALPLVVKRAVALGGDPAPGGGTVPPRHIFVVGDNPESNDSRHYGPVPLTCVVGRVVARLGQLAESAA
jgi:type IV secretory pathway protease TraF